MEKSGVSLSKGLLWFTVFTNVSTQGDTVSFETLNSPRGRQIGGKGVELCAPEQTKVESKPRHSEQRAICLSPVSMCSNVKERER